MVATSVGRGDFGWIMRPESTCWLNFVRNKTEFRIICVATEGHFAGLLTRLLRLTYQAEFLRPAGLFVRLHV